MNDKQCGKKRQLGCGALGGADGEGTHNYVIFADEDIEIADLLFQPDDDTESADNGSMGEEQRREITEKLETMAVPMDRRDFTREEYEKLFPRGTVETPIGLVKIGKNQFEKLKNRDDGTRQHLMGAMYQTLNDPVVVISENSTDEKAVNIYVKSFIGNTADNPSFVMTVVVNIDKSHIAVSTYKRKKREVFNKIKKADGIPFVKEYGGGGTNGDGTPPTPPQGAGFAGITTPANTSLSSTDTDKSSARVASRKM